MTDDDYPSDDEFDKLAAYQAWQDAERYRQPWAATLRAEYERRRGDT